MIFIRVTALELSMQSQCLLYDFFSFRCVCELTQKKKYFLTFQGIAWCDQYYHQFAPNYGATEIGTLSTTREYFFLFCLSLCSSSPIECERQRTQRSNCLLCLSVFLTSCSFTTFYKREKKKSFHTIEFLFNQRP